MSNHERIVSMTPEQLAQFLTEAVSNPPWSEKFARECCDKCQSETVRVEGYHKPIKVYPCDYAPSECPIGDSAAWWLEQEATG